MSDRLCNYCSLSAMERYQKGKGKKLVKIPSKYTLGGYEVHAVKKGEKPSKNNWICWMMEIPLHCRC